jgi:SET domain-containing protein
MGNASRFINHSCDPNCETQKWIVNKQPRIALIAIKGTPHFSVLLILPLIPFSLSSKDIADGEELTYDYHFEALGVDMKACQCGATSCSGFLGRRKPSSKTKKSADVNMSEADEQAADEE